MCPITGGALKKAKGGGWVHAACALWVPELGYTDVVNLDLVEGAACGWLSG